MSGGITICQHEACTLTQALEVAREGKHHEAFDIIALNQFVWCRPEVPYDVAYVGKLVEDLKEKICLPSPK